MTGEPTISTGPQGETLAARFLERLGWLILRRNYRAAHAEIDLIARDGDDVVFVEVKSMKAGEFGEPEDRVELAKQRQLSRAALHYVRERSLQGESFRFDVLAVLFGDGEPRIQHFRDAFDLHASFRV